MISFQKRCQFVFLAEYFYLLCKNVNKIICILYDGVSGNAAIYHKDCFVLFVMAIHLMYKKHTYVHKQNKDA